MSNDDSLILTIQNVRFTSPTKMADVFHTWLDCGLWTRIGSELDQGGDAGFFE